METGDPGIDMHDARVRGHDGERSMRIDRGVRIDMIRALNDRCSRIATHACGEQRACGRRRAMSRDNGRRWGRGGRKKFSLINMNSPCG
jgi:hypothetical protein